MHIGDRRGSYCLEWRIEVPEVRVTVPLCLQPVCAQKAGKRAGLPVDYIPEDAAGNNQTFEIEGGSQTINFDITGPLRPK